MTQHSDDVTRRRFLTGSVAGMTGDSQFSFAEQYEGRPEQDDMGRSTKEMANEQYHGEQCGLSRLNQPDALRRPGSQEQGGQSLQRRLPS